MRPTAALFHALLEVRRREALDRERAKREARLSRARTRHTSPAEESS
jgi:hypothetical protein